MKKVLYMNEPIIDTYNSYASISSILNGKNNIEPWFYNNFINIRYSKETRTFRFLHSMDIFRKCPYVFAYQVPDTFVKEIYKTSFVEFAKDSINNNQYLNLKIDWYYIASHNSFMKEHYEHEIFLYGYDDDVQHFYGVGYVNGLYNSILLPYKEIEQAFTNISNMRYKRIELVEVLQERNCKINYEKIQQSVSDYINSYRSYEMLHDYNMEFGVESIKCHLDYMNESGRRYFDARPFHFLYDHKRLMLNRIMFLSKEKYIYASEMDVKKYYEIVNGFLSTRNLILKHNLAPRTETLKKVTSKILDLVEKDNILLAKIF